MICEEIRCLVPKGTRQQEKNDFFFQNSTIQICTRLLRECVEEIS